MLFAARSDDTDEFEARGVPGLELEGLDRTAASALITRRAAGAIAPAVRDVLVAQAGGNALALVELGSALTAAQLTGDEPLPQALPLTRDVRRLLLARVRRLPAPAQRLLLIAAADDTRHPLVRSAVYQDATLNQRRRAHLRSPTRSGTSGTRTGAPGIVPPRRWARMRKPPTSSSARPNVPDSEAVTPRRRPRSSARRT
jgi:hypothetical protein